MMAIINTVIYVAILLSTVFLTVNKMMRFKMKNPCPNGINHVTFVINMFARTGLTFDGYIKHFYKTIYWPFVSKLTLSVLKCPWFYFLNKIKMLSL